jgi:hypothetical protein
MNSIHSLPRNDFTHVFVVVAGGGRFNGRTGSLLPDKLEARDDAYSEAEERDIVVEWQQGGYFLSSQSKTLLV